MLFLAAAAWAQGDDAAAAHIREALDRGAHEVALARADVALKDRPADKLLLYLRTQVQQAIARTLQRTKGYAAALEYLEDDLTHRNIAVAYMELCVWAGEEERGLEKLEASGLPASDILWPRCRLLSHLRRYDEIVELAGALRDPTWRDWARKEADRQHRFADRASRARKTAVVATVVLLAACVALYRLAPARLH